MLEPNTKNPLSMKLSRFLLFAYFSVCFAALFSSCVNDLESIKKVTYDPKAPDEVTKNLRVFYTDSGYARDSVQLVNYEKKQRMETEALFWNQKDSAIYTTSNVVVRSPDGIVYGDGIRTKQDFSTYEFLKPHGRINMGKK